MLYGGSNVSNSDRSGTSWPAGAKAWETAMKAVAVGAAEKPQRLGSVGAISSSLSLSSPASHHCFAALLVHWPEVWSKIEVKVQSQVLDQVVLVLFPRESVAMRAENAMAGLLQRRSH
jgi:hypothetical protein